MKMLKICEDLPELPSYSLFDESIVTQKTPRGIGWIYFLCENETTVRYIGKTNHIMQRMSRHKKPKNKSHCSNWMLKMIRTNSAVNIVLVEKYTSENWIEKEKHWIKFGRDRNWNLTNLTEGGEGILGHTYTMSEDRKLAISRAKKGHTIVSEKQKEALRQHNLGKKHSEETKRKISLSSIGRPRQHASKRTLGYKHTEESKRKMSEAAKRRPKRTLSLATREKMRQAALLRESRKQQSGPT